MRIQTVLSTGWTGEYIHVPAVFFEFGWNCYLPQGMHSVMWSVSSFIYQGYSKVDIFFYMKEEAEKLALEPYPIAQNRNIWYQSDQPIHSLFVREQRCEAILARSSLAYPTSIQEMVQLLIDIGILIEVKYRDTIYLDLILKPFPRPEESLIITPEEMVTMKKQRDIDLLFKGG